VVATAANLKLNNAANLSLGRRFFQVSISDEFTTLAPATLPRLANGFTVPASACFRNNS
jgi:hypothetical protein